MLSKIENDYKKKCFLLLDSLSTLLIYSTSATVGRFLQVIIGRVKKNKGSFLATIEKKMHEEKDIITIQHFMDSLIEMKISKNKQYYKYTGVSNFSKKWIEIK